MRIASLVPSATEMLFALGVGDQVAGVTHECDFPAVATTRKRLTRSVLPADLPPAKMDAAVRDVRGRGEALYELDEHALAELGVDLIVTQAVCAVCAVSYDDVRAVAAQLPTQPAVLSLDPSTLGDVLDDVDRLARAIEQPHDGWRLRHNLEQRLQRVRSAVARAPRPRVLALEWLDPPFVGGHWVPEMIDCAGGVDILAKPGDRSRTAEWAELAAARPDVVVVMPCGYYVDDAAAHAHAYLDQIASLDASAVYAVDAAASFSRPGPRLVDGVELLAHLLHPDRAAAPAGLGSQPVG